jgi:hypothetical protein
MPSLYKNCNEYMQSFYKVGDLIEAAPTCMSHQLFRPSIAFIIEPYGGFPILG